MTYPNCPICNEELLIKCQCRKNLESLTRAGYKLNKRFSKTDAKLLFRKYFKSELFGKPTAFLKIELARWEV